MIRPVMPLVVDASVAVKLIVEERGSEAAYQVIARPEPLIAPDWVLLEVANALWRKVSLVGLPEEVVRQALAGLPQLFSETPPTVPLLSAGLDLSFRIRHPLYDCLYLALAIEEDCRMITADKAFKVAADRGGLGDQVELLEYIS
jgi:predicted nucleic acid-binding protein